MSIKMEMELTEWQYECEIMLPVLCTLIPVVNRSIGKDAKLQNPYCHTLPILLCTFKTLKYVSI